MISAKRGSDSRWSGPQQFHGANLKVVHDQSVSIALQHLLLHLQSRCERRKYIRFSNFFNSYAKTINKAYGRTGSLFQHAFGRVPITSDRQFWNVIAYIHQNPQKHGFVDDFRDWKYSSHGVILAEEPTVVKRDEVLKWFGRMEDYLMLHKQWITDAQATWFAVASSDLD